LFEQFFEMSLEAARLVGFAAANGPLVERLFEIVYENVEHEERVPIFVERLLGRLYHGVPVKLFPVDGGDERVVVLHENGVKKFCEVVL